MILLFLFINNKSSSSSAVLLHHIDEHIEFAYTNVPGSDPVLPRRAVFISRLDTLQEAFFDVFGAARRSGASNGISQWNVRCSAFGGEFIDQKALEELVKSLHEFLSTCGEIRLFFLWNNVGVFDLALDDFHHQF